jgi:hypothetical protein
MADDLADFKPKNADDLLKKIVSAGSTAAGDTWKSIKNEVKAQFSLIAKISLETAISLEKKEITKKQANHTLHLLELNLESTMLLLEILPFAVADAVLNAVFKIINAVVKNYTGVDFGYGK